METLYYFVSILYGIKFLFSTIVSSILPLDNGFDCYMMSLVFEEKTKDLQNSMKRGRNRETDCHRVLRTVSYRKTKEDSDMVF